MMTQTRRGKGDRGSIIKKNHSRTLLLGPRPGISCGSVHSNSHMTPSWPGCLPIRGSARISSSVTSSLLNRPPCTTKNRLQPPGPRIGGSDEAKEPEGGRVALIIVASGTALGIEGCCESLDSQGSGGGENVGTYGR